MKMGVDKGQGGRDGGLWKGLARPDVLVNQRLWEVSVTSEKDNIKVSFEKDNIKVSFGKDTLTQYQDNLGVTLPPFPHHCIVTKAEKYLNLWET